ncbi:MAG: hypothetical protein ACRDK5_01100 [Solirubrobacterales bacterium]
MAGIGTDTRSGLTSRARRPFAAVLISLIAGLALLSFRGAASPPAAEAQVSCPPLPPGLSPAGPGATRFTMLIRINQQGNVDTYANFNEATGGLGGRVRPQDIFVINTRFQTTTPAVASELATDLRAAFPCNRIIALNGMSFDPTVPGYAFSLIDHPDVYALITNFEPTEWNTGRLTDPTRPVWNQKYSVALPRIKGWDALMAGTLAANPSAAPKRSGLVPIDDATWNYGQIAQDLDKKNSRLGGRHLGPQSVMTQDACAEGGPTGYSNRVKAILDQYKFKFIQKTVKRKGKKRKITVRRKLKKKGRPSLNNLSLQISFSDTPTSGSGMAITSTSATTAAQCAAAGLKLGGGAFFFFASDASMRLLFQQPEIAFLRPPTT